MLRSTPETRGKTNKRVQREEIGTMAPTVSSKLNCPGIHSGLTPDSDGPFIFGRAATNREFHWLPTAVDSDGLAVDEITVT